MANILVTGGTGQIGTFVCSQLLQRDHRVVAYDFKPNPGSFAGESKNKPEILSGDIQDLEELLRVIKTRQITHVIHLAALLVVESKEHPARAVRVNCVGTNNVFEAARLADLKRVLFTSSVAVYGSPKNFLPDMVASEDDYPRCPPDPYSITKLANELTSEYYRESYGLDILCLRLAGAWGPGRYTGYTGQFNNFIRRAGSGEKAVLPEDFAFKGAKMRFFYVKEMGACIAHAALVEKNRIKRGLYNAGTSKPFKALDIIETIQSLKASADISYRETDQPTKLSSEIAGPSGLDVDCSRLYSELGFMETMNLKEAVADMIASEGRI